MFKLTKETKDRILRYISISRSDLTGGDIVGLINEINGLEPIEETIKNKQDKK